MCFFWKPGRAAINQGRHFHAPHFSWFLSEFPPFLSPSTLAPLLPAAALAEDHGLRGVAGWPSTLQSLGERFLHMLCCLTLDGSDNGGFTIWTASFSRHPSQIMHSLKSQSGWPTVTGQELPVLPPTALVLMWP